MAENKNQKPQPGQTGQKTGQSAQKDQTEKKTPKK